MLKTAKLLLFWVAVAKARPACKPESFQADSPKHFGLEVVKITAEEVLKWNEWTTSVPATPGLPSEPKEIDFCDVKVYYTHPGLNDTIRVDVWMPLKYKSWNGRFLGQGGLGWASGNVGALASGVAMGMAAAQTDSGHNFAGHPSNVALSSRSWAFASPGNANLHQMQNFGYRCLDDLAVISKHIVQTYYNWKISYSYWNGCSTGGRQGLELAQRYPKHFQGVLVSAPAQNWATFLIGEHWAHVKMKELDYYPPACELQAIQFHAMAACDELDGVRDNVIADHKRCNWNPEEAVGRKFLCGEGDERKISKKAAQIAAAVWSGPTKNGKPVWHGLAQEASLAGIDTIYRGLASTDCDKDQKKCKSAPFGISADYIKNWVLKDADFDMTEIDEERFWEIFRTSRQQYHSFLDANDPDLEPFQAAGGKLLQWHGLADQLIPPNGSLNYYLRVQQEMGNTDDFYRYFEAPGVAHCFGGDGAFPLNAFRSLVLWVEQGAAPDSILAESVPELSSDPKRKSHTRPLCRWPQVQQYIGGHQDKAKSFTCADDFGEKKASDDSKNQPKGAKKSSRGGVKVPVLDQDKIDEILAKEQKEKSAKAKAAGQEEHEEL